MTKLTRFFATCLLVVSMSAIALADGEGGILQTPPAPVPPPAAESNTDSSSASAAEAVQDSSGAVESAEEMLTNWLVAAIF